MEFDESSKRAAVYYFNTGTEKKPKWEVLDYPKIEKWEIEDEPDG